jgi:hypothetical protein
MFRTPDAGKHSIAAFHLVDSHRNANKNFFRISYDRECKMRQRLIRLHFHHFWINDNERISSGVKRKSMLAISALIQTLFPLPVVPATSRCGICARSAMIVLP